MALGSEGAPKATGPHMEQLPFNPDTLLMPLLYHTLSISDDEVTLEGHACPTFFLCIYLSLFLAALGLRYCMGFLWLWCAWVPLYCLRELLTAVASRCGVQAAGTWASGVAARGLSSHGSQALGHRLSSCIHGLCCFEAWSFRTRDGAHALCLGRWSLPH